MFCMMFQAIVAARLSLGKVLFSLRLLIGQSRLISSVY